jgi:hypothetical protein
MSEKLTPYLAEKYYTQAVWSTDNVLFSGDSNLVKVSSQVTSQMLNTHKKVNTPGGYYFHYNMMTAQLGRCKVKWLTFGSFCTP